MRPSPGRFVAAAIAVLCVTVPATSAAAPQGSVMLLTDFNAMIVRVDYREQNRRQEAAFRCCIRSIRGQPLKGTYCSPKYLDYAFRRGVIRIDTGSDGRKRCVPTGRPF